MQAYVLRQFRITAHCVDLPKADVTQSASMDEGYGMPVW